MPPPDSEVQGTTEKLEKAKSSLEVDEPPAPPPAEDDDESATGENTSSSGYIIGDDQKLKHPLPPDATNIDGIHRY